MTYREMLEILKLMQDEMLDTEVVALDTYNGNLFDGVVLERSTKNRKHEDDEEILVRKGHPILVFGD